VQIRPTLDVKISPHPAENNHRKVHADIFAPITTMSVSWDRSAPFMTAGGTLAGVCVAALLTTHMVEHRFPPSRCECEGGVRRKRSAACMVASLKHRIWFANVPFTTLRHRLPVSISCAQTKQHRSQPLNFPQVSTASILLSICRPNLWHCRAWNAGVWHQNGRCNEQRR
jgi:hypothetical protein